MGERRNDPDVERASLLARDLRVLVGTLKRRLREQGHAGDLTPSQAGASAPDPTDGRQTLLALTPACRARITADRAAREDWLSRAIRRELNAAEQDQLAAAIALLKRVTAS